MKTKTKNTIKIFLVVIIASLIPAFIFGKWGEAVIFIISHTLIRQQFARQYHHILPEMCRTISGLIVFFGITLIFPFELSILSAIPINYLIGWVGKTKADSDYYENKYEKLKAKCDKLQEQLADPKNVMLKKCELAKLSGRDTKIALMYYCERKTPKDIWLWLCNEMPEKEIEWDSVYQILWRIGKKIKNIENVEDL